MSVPLPAPDGPVTTKTGLPVEEANQLVTLAVGEPTDRLRLTDAALVEQTRCFHAAELRHGHEHVEDLRGRDELGRGEQDLIDLDLPGLQVSFELSALDADIVRPLERLHSLIE